MSASLELTLTDARFHGYHGVFEQERTVGNEFAVDLTATLLLDCRDTMAATITDELADTISYADLYDRVRENMTVPCRLLEHLAARIVDDLAARWPQIESLHVRITKLAPPIPGSDCRASVAIIWRRPTMIRNNG